MVIVNFLIGAEAELKMVLLEITDSSGREWSVTLNPDRICTIGRAPDNDVVLDDPRASRYHAFVIYKNGGFVIVDGMRVDGQIKRSANHLFINGTQYEERALADGDRIVIGASTLRFSVSPPQECQVAVPLWEDTALESVRLDGPFLETLNVAKEISNALSMMKPEVAARIARSRNLQRTSDKPQNSGARDLVDCTVFAPPAVNPQHDDNFLVQIFAHLFEQAEEAADLAQEFDETAKRRGFTTLVTEVEPGSRLTFHLSMPGLEISNPIQTLIWRRRPEAGQFAVSIPRNVVGGNKTGTVTISQDSVPIGQITFVLRLSLTASSDQSELTGEASIYKKAFISYAAQDRNEVLKRVQMLSRLRINFFQDVLDLEPGARWEHELYRHIDESDLFLLFWSNAAKESKWVMEEVRYAMKRKAGDDSAPPAIMPVIIEGPPPVAPPEELSHLHFNDYLMYLQV